MFHFHDDSNYANHLSQVPIPKDLDRINLDIIALVALALLVCDCTERFSVHGGLTTGIDCAWKHAGPGAFD